MLAVRTLEVRDLHVVGHVVRVVQFNHVEFAVVVLTGDFERCRYSSR